MPFIAEDFVNNCRKSSKTRLSLQDSSKNQESISVKSIYNAVPEKMLINALSFQRCKTVVSVNAASWGKKPCAEEKAVSFRQ